MDFGGTPYSWTLTPGISGLSSGYSIESRSSTNGSSFTSYTAGLIQPPAQYGQVQITLTAGTTQIVSLNWSAVVEASRPAPDIFQRLISNDFRLGVDTGPQDAPAMQIIPPAGSDTICTVANDRITVAGNSPALAVSFDLTRNTLSQLATLLQANLPNYTVALLSPPAGWPGSSLSSVQASVLAPTFQQALYLQPTLNLWTSPLWRWLKPVGWELGQTAVEAAAVGVHADLLRARSYWLDRWGDYLGLARYTNEPDDLYRNRLIALRFRPNTAMGLKVLLGYTITTTAPATYEVLVPMPLSPSTTAFSYSQDQIADIVDEQNTAGFDAILDWELSPSDQVVLSDSLTYSVTTNGPAYYSWSGAVTYGYNSGDWSSATLTNADATTRPGSVILASGQTSGTAVTPALDLGPVGDSTGNTLTPTWSAYTDGSTSVSLQIRFSSDGTSWGSYQSLTSGTPITTIPDIYAQVSISLSGTTSDTPQFNNLRLLLTTKAKYGASQWVS